APTVIKDAIALHNARLAATLPGKAARAAAIGPPRPSRGAACQPLRAAERTPSPRPPSNDLAKLLPPSARRGYYRDRDTRDSGPTIRVRRASITGSYAALQSGVGPEGGASGDLTLVDCTGVAWWRRQPGKGPEVRGCMIGRSGRMTK